MLGQIRKGEGQDTRHAEGEGSRWKEGCGTMPFLLERRTMASPVRVIFLILFCLPVSLSVTPFAAQAQTPPESAATTEHSCSFGMAKGDAAHQCQVPIPAGCVIAKFPGTDKPWTTVSKAGRTFCTFDTKGTDWKTKITGQCTRCDSGHCSGQFMVRFECIKP